MAAHASATIWNYTSVAAGRARALAVMDDAEAIMTGFNGSKRRSDGGLFAHR